MSRRDRGATYDGANDPATLSAVMTSTSKNTSDARLESLLRQSESSMTVVQVRELVRCVAAAPAAVDPDAWMCLVAPGVDEALRKQLRALHKKASKTGGGDGPTPAARLGALRQELEKRGLDGLVVPRADEHQGEYTPARAKRLAWLTGFTGSAGLAVVLKDTAAVFVDGRYTLQVREQVDESLYVIRHLTEEPATGWIAETLPEGARLGYDPWLHTKRDVDRLRKACEKAGGSLVASSDNLPVASGDNLPAASGDNPIDAVWTDQPPPPVAPVVPHAIEFAGRSSADKRRDLAQDLAKGALDAVVLTASESIAWLLNIRGGDVPRTPLPLSFAIVGADGSVDLFIDPRKLAPGLAEHLGDDVRPAAPDAFGPALDRLGKAGKAVGLDPDTSPSWAIDRARQAGARIVHGADPCLEPKARKNPVELNGTRAAHRRDGAAMVRFLAWLDREAPAGRLTEIEAADKLESLRRENDHFRGLSFDTISGAGPNGAIVHYRVGPETNRRLEPGSLYLVDSGGQYLDGTTDVTRTIPVGDPSDEMRRRFTLVLKGHIALAVARFPKGTTGAQLDALARRPLWEAGLDYDHGTGHGVGSYLGVHEGPHRISKAPNRVALEAGMIVSNEPGYYKTGAYGIRIENLITVVAAAAPDGADKDLLGFETLTHAPIDRRLVEAAILSADEIAWLDGYHDSVRDQLSPLVNADDASWLAQATQPVVTT